jgi:hypothetical protein
MSSFTSVACKTLVTKRSEAQKKSLLRLFVYFKKT